VFTEVYKEALGPGRGRRATRLGGGEGTRPSWNRFDPTIPWIKGKPNTPKTPQPKTGRQTAQDRWDPQSPGDPRHLRDRVVTQLRPDPDGGEKLLVTVYVYICPPVWSYPPSVPKYGIFLPLCILESTAYSVYDPSGVSKALNIYIPPLKSDFGRLGTTVPPPSTFMGLWEGGKEGDSQLACLVSHFLGPNRPEPPPTSQGGI